MFNLTSWQVALLGLGLAVIGLLMAIWWRQQTYRWIIVVAICVALAPLLSWWSGIVFQVADYRAGCDGLCPGYSGAPIPFVAGETAGRDFLYGRFLVNSQAYIVILLSWSMVLRVILLSLTGGRGRAVRRVLTFLALLLIPLAITPWILPPPEAHVRGDPQRIAINAQREVYLYDSQARAPVLRVGLADVRPRRDGQGGMRVCLCLYTLFYLPIGHMYLDMTPEGVHSNAGGVLAPEQTCWQ